MIGAALGQAVPMIYNDNQILPVSLGQPEEYISIQQMQDQFSNVAQSSQAQANAQAQLHYYQGQLQNAHPFRNTIIQPLPDHGIGWYIQESVEEPKKEKPPRKPLTVDAIAFLAWAVIVGLVVLGTWLF